MKRTKRIFQALIWIAVLTVLGIPQLPARAQENEPLQVKITQVDTSDFPTVTVYVSVLDSTGEPAPVSLDRILLYENGKLIKPESITGIGESYPLTTLLLIDISGSMSYIGKIDAAKTAAIAYVDQMRPDDEAGILSFNSQIIYLQAFTSDHDRLQSAIQGLSAETNTALYDAILQGVDLLQNVTGRKAMIVLSDGMDTASKNQEADVLAVLGSEDFSISTIGLGDPTQKTDTFSGINEPLLIDLAQRAGGQYGRTDDPAALRAIYEQYGRGLQSEYVITYISPSTLRDGVNRSLSVTLADTPDSIAGKSSYNPGGLVPEVELASKSSWPLFLTLLALLAVLLFAPAAVRFASERIQANPVPTKSSKPAASRIRLQEPKESKSAKDAASSKPAASRIKLK
jgi:VWFA-related protein